jgi:putative two-component system response regulator
LKNLLFVDDESKVLDGLRRMLRTRRDEWECYFAASVDEAKAVVASVSLDAVVSDVNMPGENGLDLLRHVRNGEETKYLPVLMLTGNGDVNTKREALELGATDFLNKPFDFVELTARLQNAIAIKSFQDEIRAQNALLEQRVAHRTVELEKSRRDIILRLAKAADTRDAETGNHIVRVGIVAQMLAAKLGYDASFQQNILVTAPLHDVGKIGVTDNILRKAGPLSTTERRTMQDHCRIGAEILTEDLGPVFKHFDDDESSHENKLLQMAARIALRHHERWDGAGYPDGVAGEEIPIEARIVSVADVYDALRSRRPYKSDLCAFETRRIVVEGAGTQFDPAVVEVFDLHFDAIEDAVAHLREDEAIVVAA